MRTLALTHPGGRRHALLVALAIAATLAVAALGVLANLSLMAVTACAAPVVERYVLNGDRLEICDLAGSVRVTAGNGNTAELFVKRGGRDAARLRIVRDTRGDVTRLHVVYPERRIVYRNMKGHGRSILTVGRDGCLGHQKGLFGRRVTIASSGRGLEAWADLELRVPRGWVPTIRLGVGDITASGVDGTVVLDIGSGPVTVERTRGSLSVDTGSGSVTLGGHEGELSVDTGSGHVEVADVRGGSVRLDTGSGHVRCSAVAADDLVVDTGSGGVGLEGVRAPRIHVDTGSGSVRIALDSAPRDLVVDTGSGAVSIVAPADLGAMVDLESGSGGIDTDFTLSTISHDHGELHGTIGDGRGHIRVDTGSGGVSLRRR